MHRIGLGWIFTLFMLSTAVSQQDTNTIILINPSFEGEPRCCKPPAGWIDCGWKNETPPDIQPAPPGFESFFGVVTKPYHGQTYLGMVTRENDSYERIAQSLSQPLKKGRCYSFSIYLCRSLEYLSKSHADTNTLKPFTTPVVLRISGGDAYCHQKELLAESEPVKNTEWKLYTFEFNLKSDIQYLELEAFYKTPVLMPYNGNLLLDNASTIKRIKCPNETPPISKADKKSKTLPVKKDENKTSANGSVASENKILKDLDKDKIKLGQIIKIEKLYFKSDSSNIDSSSYAVLEEVYDFLVKNPKIKIEIGGHTNSQPTHEYCDKLSASRARSVREYIIKKGITDDRIISKGYGKRQPIATNDTKAGKALNQRVEIKIISVG